MPTLPEPPPPADLWARIPVPHPQTACTEIDGQAVIVLADAGQMLALNETGTRLWALLDGRRSAAGLAEALHVEFAVARDAARADTLAFLEQFAAIGALTWAEAGPA